MSRSNLLFRLFALSILALGVQHRVYAQATEKYQYAEPTKVNDGLQTGSLEAAGFDEAMIVAGTNQILNHTYPGIRSLLILRDNKLVYEHYFSFLDSMQAASLPSSDVLQDLRSITKTIVGATVLIAHAQGAIENLDQSIFEFFPEYAAFGVNGKENITIRHLMTMSAGLEWNEEISYLDPLNSERIMQLAPDAIEFVLSRDLITKPGSTFSYCGGCSHVLADIVRRSTGMPVDAFAEQHIFKPLGISSFEWAKAPLDGLPYGFSGLKLRSRDVAKIGLLFMNQGKWGGTQIIPETLITDAKSEHVIVDADESTGDILSYGYQVWRFSFAENGLRTQLIQMSGNGGQAVFLNEKDDTLVIITASNFDQMVDNSSIDFYLDYIYPAVLERR